MKKETLFLNFLRSKAAQILEDSPGHGEWGDNGAGELKTQIDIYEAALKHDIPKCWKAFHEEFEKTGDPEFNEYKRLEKKFKGPKK